MMIPEQQLQNILSEHKNAPWDPNKFRNWFKNHFSSKASHKNCNIEEFAIYFIQTLHQCTEQHLRTNENNETTKSQTPVKVLKQKKTISSNDSAISSPIPNLTPSPPPLPPPPQQQQKVKSFNQNVSDVCGGSQYSNPCTPVHSTPKQKQMHNASHRISTSTPQSSEKRDNTSNSSCSGLCLGDFLAAATPTHTRSKKKTPQHGHDSAASKPKKRVVPTTISKSLTNETPFGTPNSAFSNDSNFLRLTENIEISDKSQCAIMEARKSLKKDANEISKELVTQMSQLKLNNVPDTNCAVEQYKPVMLKLTNVTNEGMLNFLAKIYSVLFDINLVPNVLSELAHMLQILNVLYDQTANAIDKQQRQGTPPGNNSTKDAGNAVNLTLLHNIENSIYFALRLLEKQRDLLLQLDIKSLGVVLNIERIDMLSKDLTKQIQDAYQYKQSLLSQPLQEFSIRFQQNSKSVYYEHDKDSRENFPSNTEFNAFKTQRDLFYKSFKTYETMHLYPTFNFKTELTPLIKEIFRQSENVINMAHFAKLFVAQLLISASDATTSPQELGFEIDSEKFSKLTQRLVTPGNFSVDYQFPRSQAYFRDFINECGSLVFLFQLKLALFAQLSELNDSSFEQIEIASSMDDYTMREDETTTQCDNVPFIVRAEVLASMLTLAKFLGYITALPYCQARECNSSELTQEQLQLRSNFQPDFNVYALFSNAIKSGKLLITLPWLVQYLVMLDAVTLQLPCYTETLNILFEVYQCIGNEFKSSLLPTGAFIVRCCIGWLLETKSHLSEQYYIYVARRSNANDVTAQLAQLALNSLQIRNAHNKKKKQNSYRYHPILEHILHIACPFLPQFRVAIMPAKYAIVKHASRSGRYRHITTSFASTSDAEPPTIKTAKDSLALQPVNMISRVASEADPQKDEEKQKKLIDAFMHSQQASMRRLIEFIIERTYKTVIKDAQHEILLPSKAAADTKVNALTSIKHNEILHALQSIYGQALENASSVWNERIPEMLDGRIAPALSALLPAITSDIVKQVYHQLIRRNAMQQIQQWFNNNIAHGNFYCTDFHDMAQKICKSNKSIEQVTSSSELHINEDINAVCVSDIIDDLKLWLHCTSVRPELLRNKKELEVLIARIQNAKVHTLPTVFYRLIGAGLVQLCQNLIHRHPLYLTPTIIKEVTKVWAAPEMQHLSLRVETTPPIPGIFETLLTSVFMRKLGRQREAYRRLQNLLIVMINEAVLTLDFVNNAFLTLFKENWEPDIWQELSCILTNVSKETHSHKNTNTNKICSDEDENDAKSMLIMEVLADLSRDVDF